MGFYFKNSRGGQVQPNGGLASRPGHPAPLQPSSPEFLDVQGPLLRGASLPELLARERDAKITAYVIAACGWGTVAVMLWLIK